MLAFAGYAWAVSYLIRGEASANVPMIPLPHEFQYLPALRFEMTPYGTAVTTQHTFVHDHRLTELSVGIGDTGHKRAWDIGLKATDLLRNGWVRTDLALSVWRQPALDSSPDAQVLRTGSLAAAIATVPLGRRGLGQHAGFRFEGGYKSDGFVRGERLHAGPIIR